MGEQGMYSRELQISISDKFRDATVTTGPIVVDQAIGYLACWGYGGERYASVSIFGRNDGSLTAYYRNVSGDVTYSLCGMLSEDKTEYSFHSNMRIRQ